MTPRPEPLTLGVEEEFHLVDLETRRLVARAPELLSMLPSDLYAAELQRCVVETNTAVVTGLDELRAEMLRLRRGLVDAADVLGLGVASSGTVPLSLPGELDVTETPRFRRMLSDYQLLAREQLICGMQVHVGIADRDLAVGVGQRVTSYLPVFLALTASSPFWADGSDTGYASVRSLVWQRWPTTGQPGPVRDAAEYDKLVRQLVSSGVITDPGMVYFDVRPSMHVPTLELRVCDATPCVDDAVLVAGLYRALVLREVRAHRAGEPCATVPPPLQRAAMWRAARSGVDGDLVDLAQMAPVPARTLVRMVVDELRPQLEELGDWSQVRDLTEAALNREGAAARQRRALGRHGRLRDVVDLVIEETRTGRPHADVVPPEPKELHSYRPDGYDEAVLTDGEPRPAYGAVLDTLYALGTRWLLQQEERRDIAQRSTQATFRVSGERQPRTWPVDLLPRVVPGDEWEALGRGLTQRARALDAFLRDVYGEAHIIRDGVLPRSVVESTAGWRPNTGRRPPSGAIRANVCGFDVVSDAPGHWLVLEDNLRVPSGLGYAVRNRVVMQEVARELPKPATLLPAEEAPRLLLRTLRDAAPPRAHRDLRVVLLSDGPTDSAWFEHRMLAEEMGVPLVRPDELRVVDRHLRRRHGRSWVRVDVVYLRMTEDVLGARTGADGESLEPALLSAVEAGTLTVANALGNGAADDKMMFAYVPTIIEYYLGEKPETPSVPTYLCSDPEQREYVLEHAEELVIKPVDGFGGKGIVIGPRAEPAEVERVRRRVQLDPEGWVAQDLVELSTLPSFDGTALEPRHVDLRVFVLLGKQAVVAPAALTRVAPPGSLVVNSSAGGGAKDTWLLGSPAL